MFLRGAFEYLAVTGEEKAVERCILARGEKKEGLHCDHMCPGCPVSLGSGAVDEMGPRISHQPSWTTNQFISAGASSRKPSSVLAPPTVTSCPLLHLWITLITSNLEFQPKGKPAAKILLGGEHFLSLHPLSRLPLRTAIIPAIMRPECPYLLCSGRRGDRCLPSSLREQTPCLWPGPHPSPGPQPHLPAF